MVLVVLVHVHLPAQSVSTVDVAPGEDEVLDEWAIHAGLPRGEELVDEVQILDVEQVYPVPESGEKMPPQPPVDLREIGDPPQLVIELAGVVERRHPRQFHLLCPLVEASKDDGAGRVLALEA